MKYIKLVNFVDICSNSFLKVIDDVYDKAYFVQDQILINLDTPRIKKLLEYHTQENLKQRLRGYGEIKIVINTCRPWDNWRKELRGSAIKASKFTVTDSSLIINNRRLEIELDKIWRSTQLIFNNVHFIEHPHLDSFDLDLLINARIGANFISTNNNRFLTIQDSNQQYLRNLQDTIPDYLVSEVERSLVNLGLITNI